MGHRNDICKLFHEQIWQDGVEINRASTSGLLGALERTNSVCLAHQSAAIK